MFLIVSHDLAGPVTASVARKFRLKCRSVEKHVSLRRRRRGSGPRGNVVVERRSGPKHKTHFSHLRCVPTSNVLVERRSGIKHSSHKSHLRCIPIPNGLVERRSALKHKFHSSHLRCVPTPNVSVERTSVIKHIIHSSHFPGVPLRNVAVECTFTTKALNTSIISTHIFHQTRIPIRHRPVPNVFRSSPVYTFSSLRNHCRFHPTPNTPRRKYASLYPELARDLRTNSPDRQRRRCT